ncbi:hypothetical protein BGX28_008368 [Mortierella sp. GBA30]|nr:hypothetical protein BGX28_008368 [Mortierella sp. GBA30]
MPHPLNVNSYHDSSMKASSAPTDSTLPSISTGSKKQKTTPPCDRCRQRRIKCDRLEPTCSSCIKYKAICVRTSVPAGAPLSTVSVDAIGGHGLRVLTSAGKRDRHLSETEVLDSCLRDVRSLQLNRLQRIEQFFDRLGIDETRIDEVSWLAEQIKVHRESVGGSDDLRYHPEEIVERLGLRASVPWIKQLLPLLQATKRVQQLPSTAHVYPKSSPSLTNGAGSAIQATLSEAGQFIYPNPRPTTFPIRVPLSVLNKTMFELSVYDHTEYLGPVAGTRASSWSEEMRFTLPWLVPEPQVQEPLLVLPPMDHMLELIEWMIQSPMYTYFPILTKASILNALSAALPDPDAPSLGIDKPFSNTYEEGESFALPHRITGRVSAVFLLNAIMALGAAYRSNAIKENKPHRLLLDPKSREKSAYDFQLFFDRSRAIPGIQNLYREQACAMALSLGLHRDCESWTLCRSVIQLRRNIFWCCYVIDASYSLNSGSPERFPDDYISIGLPELPSIEQGDDIGEIEAENEVRRIGFLIEQAKLWRIVKKIRRCGQTSHRSVDGYCEASNVFRNPESGVPSSLSTVSEASLSSSSPNYGYSANGLMSQAPSGQNGAAKPPISSPMQPSWVWRADSARRILDVELAQWQMDLPSHLRFDFAMTRKDDPCPLEMRVNGLGAMLQLIFNEVLILLHHPFLVLADAQSQHKRDHGAQSSGLPSKSRSSISSTKGSRSRRSSSTSKSSVVSNSVPPSDGSIAKASRSLPPFLNSCTKAAEAITFLVDHLLHTTPEWLVCHNETDSALHIAERVHALNVSIAAANSNNSNVPGAPSSFEGSASRVSQINGTQARYQLKKTKAFRKQIADLDQFTMSDGFRLELMTKERIERGYARERLMRCMRNLLTHKRSADYYRLPRSPPETESSTNLEGHPVHDGHEQEYAENGAGQDHLEMKLAFKNDRIWIRYYNVRIKDGTESKNGAESWLEVLNPYVAPVEPESDSEEEETSVHMGGQYPFESAADNLEDESTSADGPSKLPFQRRRTDSGEIAFDDMVEPLDPLKSLMQVFNTPNPTGIVPYSGMVAGSTYYPDQEDFAVKKDYGVIGTGYNNNTVYYGGEYAPQDVPLERPNGIESPMALDGSFQPEHQTQGFPMGNHGSSLHQEHDLQQQQQQQRQQTQQQQQQQHASYSQALYSSNQQQQSHPLQQDQSGTFPHFNLHTPSVMNFDQAVGSPTFSSPESPSHSIAATTEATMGLGLLSVSTPIIPPHIAFDGGPYLNILHQQFPNQHVPTQPQGAASMQSFQHQQSFDPSVGAMGDAQQGGVRPFYGMPMGGFMAPSLDALPEISRNANVQQPQQQQQQQQQQRSHPPSTTMMSPTMESNSPPLPPSLVSSVPASPLTQTSYRMLLSPTSDELQAISNRFNAWDGLTPKTDSLDLDPASSSSGYSSVPATVAPTSNLGGHQGSSNYTHSWSPGSSASEMMSNNGSTPGSTGASSSSSSTDGFASSSAGDMSKSMSMDVEAGSSSPTTASLLNGSTHLHNHHRHHPQHQHHHPHQHHVSAVPEAPYGEFATSNPDDPVRLYRLQKENEPEQLHQEGEDMTLANFNGQRIPPMRLTGATGGGRRR